MDCKNSPYALQLPSRTLTGGTQTIPTLLTTLSRPREALTASLTLPLPTLTNCPCAHSQVVYKQFPPPPSSLSAPRGPHNFPNPAPPYAPQLPSRTLTSGTQTTPTPLTTHSRPREALTASLTLPLPMLPNCPRAHSQVVHKQFPPRFVRGKFPQQVLGAISNCTKLVGGWMIV